MARFLNGSLTKIDDVLNTVFAVLVVGLGVLYYLAGRLAEWGGNGVWWAVMTMPLWLPIAICYGRKLYMLHNERVDLGDYVNRDSQIVADSVEQLVTTVE